MRSNYLHLYSNFHIQNLLDFINGTCETITRRNMNLGGQSLRSPLIKFAWEQQENQAGNTKAIFQDTKINLTLLSFCYLISGKCSSLIRNLILQIFENGVSKYL